MLTLGVAVQPHLQPTESLVAVMRDRGIKVAASPRCVSPRVFLHAALMENQVAAMRGRGIACSMLSSAQPAAERADTLGRLQASPPQLSLLFVTPELISTDGYAACNACLSRQ